MRNALCSGACPTFNGIPVFLAIKNPSLGSVTKSSPSSTALVVVDGPTSKVTITAP